MLLLMFSRELLVIVVIQPEAQVAAVDGGRRASRGHDESSASDGLRDQARRRGTVTIDI